MKPLLSVALLSSVSFTAALAQSGAMLNTGYARAARFFMAAEKGESEAQFELGMLHEKGEVVPQNHREAAKWFRLAAEDGYAPAQMFMGLMYLSGKGVDRNPIRALKYLTLAAEQNHTDAQFILGGLYFGDSVMPHNYVEAYKWFRVAGRKGNGDSLNPLDSLGKKMTPQQVAEAERLAEEFSKAHKPN